MENKSIEYYGIDYQTTDAGFVSNPHSHRHYEILYFVKGNASHFIDFEEYQITDNSFFLVSYNQVHYITAKPNTYNSGYAISISQEIINLLDVELRSLFGKFSQSPVFYLRINDFFTILFQQIKNELQSSRLKSTELTLSFLNILLTYVWREQQAVVSNKNINNNSFLEYINLLENNYKQIKSVKQYSKLLSITAKQLNRVCKQTLNQTALSVIHERINLEAKRKLFYSENQVKDICYDLGFKDTGHFNNFFKKMNNKTPMKFRTEMSQIFN